MVRDYLLYFLLLVNSERAAEVLLLTNLLGGLRSCRRVSLWGLSCPKGFPVFLGLQNLWRDCSAPASNVPGSIIPDFFIVVHQQRGILVYLP